VLATSICARLNERVDTFGGGISAMISSLALDTIDRVERGKSDAVGDRALLRTNSPTFRSKGSKLASTAAASDDVDLNTREMVTEHTR